MADAAQAGGSGDFMSKFLPGLVLGLVIGLGVGAFGLPFLTDRAPAVPEGAAAPAGPRDGAPRDEVPPAETGAAADPFAGMTAEQIQQAIEDWKAAHADELADPETPTSDE